MVKIAATGLVLGGILLGSTLLKGSLEEMFIGPSKLIRPEIGIVLGIIVILFSFRRLKVKF